MEARLFKIGDKVKLDPAAYTGKQGWEKKYHPYRVVTDSGNGWVTLESYSDRHASTCFVLYEEVITAKTILKQLDQLAKKLKAKKHEQQI